MIAARDRSQRRHEGVIKLHEVRPVAAWPEEQGLIRMDSGPCPSPNLIDHSGILIQASAA
jgi:hypothetical protein